MKNTDDHLEPAPAATTGTSERPPALIGREDAALVAERRQSGPAAAESQATPAENGFFDRSEIPRAWLVLIICGAVAVRLATLGAIAAAIALQ